MTKAIAQTYNAFNENIKVVSYIFLVGSLILALVYTYSIFAVISNSVAIQNIEKKMTVLSSSVDELDSNYLSLSSNINPENLSEYGMTKGKVSQYISKSTFSKIGAADLGSVADPSNLMALRNER